MLCNARLYSAANLPVLLFCDRTPKLITLMKIWLLACCLGATPALACINDRDTLAAEVAAQKGGGDGLPPVVRAITGHFDRNPPLYYSMRLKRVAAQLQQDPKRLELYDDAGAACDRLGRSQEAIGWMGKKKRQLETLALDPQTRREHLYRYLANAGTFHGHLWLRQGANRSNTTELKTGHDMIARAVQIKPKAHFGRERYQLELMNWILNPPLPQPKEYHAVDFLGLSKLNQDDNQDRLKSSAFPDALTGLTGLIVLGDAWASFDVYHALMQAIGAQGNSTLAHFAGERCRELLDNGRKSLSPHFDSKGSGLLWWTLNYGQTLESSTDIRRKYFELRADAASYQEARFIYMADKMRVGQHPDTHPSFWAGWKAPALPSFELSDPLAKQKLQRARQLRWLGGSLLICLVGGLGFWLGKRRA